MTLGGSQASAGFSAAGEMMSGDFREMMEALPVAVYATDATGRLTYFNPAAVKLSGRVPELGSDRWCITWKLFTADGSPLAHEECPMAIALKGGPIASGVECQAERPDGSRFWFTPNLAVLRDAAGKITAGVNLLFDITERKVAELSVREQFRAIVETVPECVKIVAADGTLLHMNSSGMAMIGANSPEDVLGANVLQLVAPEDRQRFREFNAAICRGEKGSLEFDMVGLQGSRRRVETRAVPLHHTDGTVAQLALTRDVTDRRQAEEAALLLSAIVDSSDDAIISKDLNGVITSWNESAERLFGYTAAQTVGKPITMLIPPDRLDEEPEILARLRRGERVDHFETIRRRADGRLIEISLSISPVHDRAGKIVGASKIARDISERKRAEAAILASEARFRHLADAMPQMVWTADPDGRLDYCNERWYEFTGFNCDKPADLDWDSILHPDDVERLRQTWERAVESGRQYEIEHRLWDRRENRWRWFIARAIPARDAAGVAVKWFGSHTDIDAQKRVQEDLRRANNALEQFAFSASHDLQEPLRTVKVYSELLTAAYGAKLDDRAREMLRFLSTGAARMETLVRDLLAYAQVTKLESPTESTDAEGALQAALANLATPISQSNAQITSDPLPSLPVHFTHMQQLFQNLISNAIKYRSAERPPVVHVTAQRQRENWLFAVTDNGIGIEAEYVERIFGLFKRLHTSKEYSGTGIGLAICERIVDRYSGRIWVESEPGRGSTFRFTLPA
jgi:PAS domain S-box-containing protein